MWWSLCCCCCCCEVAAAAVAGVVLVNLLLNCCCCGIGASVYSWVNKFLTDLGSVYTCYILGRPTWMRGLICLSVIICMGL